MKKLTALIILFFALTLPYIVYAQTLDKLLFNIGLWVNTATPIVAGLALLVFFYGLVKFIWNGGDEEKRKEGKMAMLWGIIAIFVMVSIWGIVTVLSSSLLGNADKGSFRAPCLEGMPGCTSSGIDTGGIFGDGGNGGDGDGDGDIFGDSDGDGILDAFDKCPGTVPGTPVDSVGCPIGSGVDDSDGDGIRDDDDICSGTPPGSEVDSSGCVL